jgi:thioredoxin-like negative regulator of GroEL
MVFVFDHEDAKVHRLRDIVSSVKDEIADRVAVYIVDTNWNPEVAEALGLHTFPSLVFFKDGKTVAEIPGEFTAKGIRTVVNQHYNQPNENVAETKAALRYDGKSFDEWRYLWRTELSTGIRVDAVKALGAFARAGYGEQATYAILEVAGQYDFNNIDRSKPDGQLKETVLDELAPYYRSQPLVKYWLPALATLLEKEPQRWDWLAVHLFNRLNAANAQFIPVLRSLAQSKPQHVSGAALSALVRSSRTGSGKPQLDAETQNLLTAALTSDDPEAVRAGLQSVVYDFGSEQNMSVPRLLFQPELIPLLFHQEEPIRQHARLVLRHISENDAPQVVAVLSERLRDKSRRADAIPAVRGLSAVGSRAQSAAPQLETIMQNPSEEMPLRIAAGVALDHVEEGQRGATYLVTTVNNASDDQVKVRFSRLISEEQRLQQ